MDDRRDAEESVYRLVSSLEWNVAEEGRRYFEDRGHDVLVAFD